MHPLTELLLVCLVECNPIRGSGVKPARLDNAAIDPVVDHVRADSETLGHFHNIRRRHKQEHGTWIDEATNEPGTRDAIHVDFFNRPAATTSALAAIAALVLLPATTAQAAERVRASGTSFRPARLSVNVGTKAMMPFFLAMLVVLFLITYVPSFTMWLPSFVK